MEKIALVTGSSRGIGRATAAALARAGWAVCINYRVREDCARSLAEQLRGEGCRVMAVRRRPPSPGWVLPRRRRNRPTRIWNGNTGIGPIRPRS